MTLKTKNKTKPISSILLLIGFCLVPFISKAQTIIDTIKVVNPIDTLTIINPLDTLKQDSLKIWKKGDSVVSKVKSKISSTKELTNFTLFATNKKDSSLNSISSDKKIKKWSGDSLGIDSLKGKYNPNKKIVNLNNQINRGQQYVSDSLNKRLKKNTAKIQSRLDGLENPSDQLDKVAEGLEEKTLINTDNINSKINKGVPIIPTADINQIEIPNVNFLDQNNILKDLPKNDLPTINDEGILSLDLPILNNKELPVIDVNESMKNLGLNRPDLGIDKPILTNPIEKLSEQAKNIKGIELGNGKLDKAKEAASTIGNSKGKLDQLKKGNTEDFEEVIAEKMSVSEDLNLLKEKQIGIEAQRIVYEEKLKTIRDLQDKELLEAKLKDKLKEKATNHFNGQQEKLLAAHQELSVYKKKYEQVEGIKKLSRKEIKGVKINRFPANLLVGLDLGLTRASTNLLSLAPFVGYEINNKWQVRLGYAWHFDTILDQDSIQFDNDQNHGLRTSINYSVFKGFTAVLGYERLKVNTNNVGGIEQPKSNFGVTLIGIRKKFKIAKNLFGEGQFLYQINSISDSSFQNKMHVRFGVHWDLPARNR